MSRLKPWLQLQLSKKKKKMVLREETVASESSTFPEPKIIMWTCTVSAPEMTLVLYSINDLPLYHVSYLHLVNYLFSVSGLCILMRQVSCLKNNG